MTTRRVNVRGIIFKNSKILAQTFKQRDGSASSYWGTPGGGLELGESLQDGLYREMVEETGIAPQIGKLLFVQQFHDGTKEQLEFFFHIENVNDYETIDMSITSHGLIEIAEVAFVDPNTAPILPAFLQAIDMKSYIEKNLPTYIYSDLPV